MAIIFVLVSCSNASQYDVLYEAEKVKEEQSLKELEVKKKFRVAFIPKVGGISYFESVYEGVVEAANELEIELLYEAPFQADAKLQSQIVENMIEKDVDAIAVSVVDHSSLTKVLEKAREQGIIVVTWDSDSGQSVRDLFVDMVDAEKLGRHLMDQLAQQTNEVGEFAIMTGSFSAKNHNDWVKWIQVQWKQYYPNMKLVEVVSTNDDKERAYNVAINLLENYPNLNGIISNSSVGPPAGIQAVKNKNKVGQVAVVGLSTPNLMREHLLDGSTQVISLWSPKKLGYLTIILTNSLLENKTIEDYAFIPGVGVIRFQEEEQRVIMGESIDFTKENVNQYDF